LKTSRATRTSCSNQDKEASVEQYHGTTIVSVRRGNNVVIGGDGQVTLGNTIMKGNARKVRRLYHGKVIAGFAGGTADAFTLFERFEAQLEKHQGHLVRAAVELAKDWRTDRALRRGADRDRLRRPVRAIRRQRPAAQHRPVGPRRGGAKPEDRRRHLHLHQPESHL
jgi:hypothetical protein